MHGTIKQRIKHREDMFLRRLFGILAKMAKVDGKVDAWEAHAAEGAFARFPRAMARRKFCVSVFNSSKNGRTPLCSLAAEFEKEWAMPEDCLAVYELLWDIACAKGVLKPSHKNALRDLCVPLGLPPNYFTFFYRRRSASFREVEEEAPRHENRATRVESQRASNDGQDRGRGRNSVGNHRRHRRRHHYRKHMNCLAVTVPIQTMCCVGPIAPQRSVIIPI